MNNPDVLYRQALAATTLRPDPEQERVVAILDHLHTSLSTANAVEQGWLARLSRKQRPAVPGLYLWGRVGCGKTYLMDLLHESLPDGIGWRLHFHRFMRMVHDRLLVMGNKRDPLKKLASELAAENTVLLFDEFQVSDITDAMLLSGLLQALYEHRVTLITTANEHPDQLYAGGLQRERFLPAIELIKQHTLVHHMNSGKDYRLSFLDEAGVYYMPPDEQAQDKMEKDFVRLSSGREQKERTLILNQHPIKTRRLAYSCVWFDFEELCAGARHANDYIELASQYPVLLLSNTPVLDDDAPDATRRFIALIDELYERKVKLIISAEAMPEKLYTGWKHEAIFRRTASRLREMMGRDYLARPHQDHRDEAEAPSATNNK